MQNRDDVDGSQRPRTADAPPMKTPANDADPGGHMGAGGDPVEGDAATVEGDLAQEGENTGDRNTGGRNTGGRNSPAKE